ncbi:MAG TPA: 2,3-diphosphoglycerate-dependent phosphoglycerate mutase [Bacteroidota bacterium]|nr:2,3-diphosphoglycerate-dependent phosphoglycerate mutase [Bacteroidota bacterium]
MPQLILARHGESTYNRDGLFTGWIDAPLTKRGIAEAKAIAAKLAGFRIDKAYTSRLSRAIQSVEIVLAELHVSDVEVIKNEALNERRYGDLQGLNKEETANKYGEKQTMLWRRSYDIAPPNGESLHDAAMRVLPYVHSTIMMDIKDGLNVLVVAHGNSLRAIVKEIDRLSNDEVARLSIETGQVIVYTYENNVTVVSKNIL